MNGPTLTLQLFSIEAEETETVSYSFL